MVTINLLPWRQHVYSQQQTQLKKNLLILLGLLGGFFFVVHGVFWRVNQHLLGQKTALTTQLHQIKNATPLMAQTGMLDAISSARLSQQKWLEVLNKLSQAGMYSMQLIKIQYNNAQITIVGRARSLYEVSHWMADVQGIHLKQIKAEGLRNSDSQKFSLIFE